MPAEGPDWWELGLTNNIEVSSNDLLSITLHEEVGVDLTSSSDVSQDSLAVITVLDDWRHAVGVSEPDTHELVFLLASLNKGEWVDTVGLLETGSIVIRSFLAIGPHSPGALLKLEFSVSLTKPKDALGRQFKVDLEVLIHNVASLVDGGDESFVSVGTADFETKWIHVQLKIGHVESQAGVSIFQANIATIRLPPFLLSVFENHIDGALLGLTELERDFIGDHIVSAKWNFRRLYIECQVLFIFSLESSVSFRAVSRK